MKKLLIFLTILAHGLLGQAQDPSAIADYESTTQGVLVPRMTLIQRELISTPATGLLVYQTDGNMGFWFFNGQDWKSLNAGDISGIKDGDGDTRIEVDNGNIDEDKIRFFLDTTERFVMSGGRLEVLNNDGNVFMGSGTGQSNTTGVSNSFFGNSAGGSNFTGSFNTFIGGFSGLFNSGGAGNTFIGYSSGFFNLSGNQNTFLGENTGLNNSSGTKNLMLGSGADVNAGDLINAIAIGAESSVGCSNCAVIGGAGSQAVRLGLGLSSPRTLLTLRGPDDRENGPHIFMFGSNSDQQESGRIRFVEGTSVTNWRGSYIHYNGFSNRMHIGIHSNSDSIVANDQNVLSIDRSNGRMGVHDENPNRELTIGDLGDNGDAIIGIRTTTPQSREMIVGINSSSAGFIRMVTNHNLSFWTNNTERLRIQNSGNIGIGTTNPSVALDVNGAVNCTGGTCSSDRRWKKDVQPLKNTLSKISKLDAVSYFWRRQQFPEKQFSERKQIGLIAQEVEAVFPELVHTNLDGFKSMDYQSLTAVLLQAIKELQEEVDALKKEIHEK